MTRTDSEEIENSTTSDRREGLNSVNHDKGPVEVLLDPGWELVTWTDERGRLKVVINNTRSKAVISLTQLGKGSRQKVQIITMTTQEIDYE